MSKKKKSNKIIRNNPKNLVTGQELIETDKASKFFHLKDHDIIALKS
tara:strand:- start:327 stop:467 length:141 start_codon:yes stop_codon:yes gene_type:complete